MSTADEGRVPICPYCGVTALADDTVIGGTRFLCENPECYAYQEELEGA